MTDINYIISGVIKREGGYVNDPTDAGGPTRWGITIHTLSVWYKRQGIKDEATIDDVKNLDKDTARKIYLQMYYLDPKIDRLPECIRAFCVDSAVQHGPSQAIKFAQKSCNQNGFPAGPVDGVIGPKTEKAARQFHRQFLDDMIDLRETFCLKIVENTPSQSKYLAGWMNRLSEFEE